MIDICVTVLLALSLLLNVVAVVLFLWKKRRPAWISFVVGWGVTATVFLVNWRASGHPPFANMYHVLAVLPLCLLPFLVYLRKTDPELMWMSAAFPGLAAISLLGTLFMGRDSDWSLNPALDSPFFVPHVMSYCIAYALCGVAFVMGIAFFVSPRNRDRCLDASHELVRLAIPFMTLGMCLGAIWAEQAWGIYWSWDAKETFSLATWLVYLGFLHMRRIKHNKTLANVVQMIGFIVLLGTFFGVNLLTSIHAYAIS